MSTRDAIIARAEDVLAGAGVEHAQLRRHYAEALANAGLLVKPEPVRHHRVGPGACACGFDAYKLSEFVYDYGDRLQMHIRAATGASR